MLRAFFSFRGESNRKTFAMTVGAIYLATILGGVAMVLVAGLLAVALVFVRHAPLDPLVTKAVALLVVAPIVVGSLWASSVAYAKRARNIGLNPWGVIATSTLIAVVDRFIPAPKMGGVFSFVVGPMTPVGGSLELLLLLALFLLPTGQFSGPTAGLASKSPPPYAPPLPVRSTFGLKG